MRSSQNPPVRARPQEMAGIIGHIRPSSARASVSKRGLTRSGITAQQNTGSIKRDARCVNRRQVQGSEHNSQRIQEVIAKITRLGNHGRSQPRKRRLREQIRNRKIVGGMDNGEQIVLASRKSRPAVARTWNPHRPQTGHPAERSRTARSQRPQHPSAARITSSEFVVIRTGKPIGKKVCVSGSGNAY